MTLLRTFIRILPHPKPMYAGVVIGLAIMAVYVVVSGFWRLAVWMAGWLG